MEGKHSSTNLNIGLNYEVEQDEDIGLESSIPIEDDEERAGQLGTQIYRNFTEAHASESRDLITAKELKRVYHFQARYHYARYGTFDGHPACLIVIDVSFQEYSSFRFQSAEIEIELEDAANIDLNPHDMDIDTTYRPHVLTFEPREFHGPVTSVKGNRAVKLDIPIQAPGGLVGMTPGVRVSQDTVRDGYFKIHGVVKEDPPSLLHWKIREDKIRKAGIRSEVSLALIVKYFPGRKFAARVRLRGDILLPLLRPVCGQKDDPIYFDPDYLPRKTSKRVQELESSTSTGVGHNTVPGLRLAALDSLDLKRLTRLNAFSGGEFLG